MITDPDASPMEWATSLTPAELSHELRRLARDFRCMNAEERKAILEVAADDVSMLNR